MLVTGCGLSETQDGGYAEYSRLQGDWVIPLPAGITELDAMKLGTAGFTAALAIHRMEQNGQAPAKGPVVVTGATGGVGSLAINMLAGRGYEVVAVSGKPEADAYLRDLGASQILRRQDIDLGSKPMEAVLWAGAIDNVGGELLTWLTRTIDFCGNIASIGLAGSHELHTTVMPFILRGVNLLGINSSATPRDVRLDVWHRIATDLRPAKLDQHQRQGRGVSTNCRRSSTLTSRADGRLGRTVVAELTQIRLHTDLEPPASAQTQAISKRT